MKVLVVIDMQKDFTTGALGNAECAATIAPVTELIKKGKYDLIIATLDTHTEDYMNTNEGAHLPVVHCVKGTEGHQMADEVKAALSKTKSRVQFFEKPTFGAAVLADYFRLTDISGVKNQSDTQIDFCGVCTGICVISNVMITKSVLPEANIRVLSKACACVTPETHKTALDAMRLCHIDIVE